MKNRMKTIACLPLAGLMFTTTAKAGDSFASEFSHFAGQAIMSSAVTVVTDKYVPENEHPAMTGFLVSSAAIVIFESIEGIVNGKEQFLDTGVGIAGAAAGAFATHKWYVEPRMERQQGETTYGFMAKRKF